MFKFFKNFFNTKYLSNNQKAGFLNILKREKSMDILIERVNKTLSTH